MSADALQTKVAISTSDLTHRLLRKYGTTEESITEKYIVATQVRPNATYGDSTADAVIIGNWPSSGYEIQGFEIKTSRTDWLNEVKTPSKADPTKKYCHRWWLLISSETYVKDGELPDDWGLMVAHGTGIRIVVQAPTLEPVPPSVQFITGLMRANKRAYISEDLHAQYLQDHRRLIEADLRKEFKGLLEFAKVVHEAFGIEFKADKKWVRDDAHPSGAYVKEWTAKIRSKWHTYDPQQLKAIIESAISGDMDKSQIQMREAYEAAEKAMELLAPYKDKSRW